ncbi:MAG: Ig-like domain-containing protein [Bacillus sp. (in: firmicutes)]
MQKTDYLNWEERTNVDSNHDWTIVVNQALDAASISNQNVYVMHNDNLVAGTKASLNDDQKSIKLEAPEKEYIAGEIYTLYVEQTVKSKSGKVLKQPIKMKFTIKK